jgi:hypothetical protein
MADRPRRGGPGPEEQAELCPSDVQARLLALRRMAVIERDEEARARLTRERRVPAEPFARAVERRLRELRALSALASHLKQARPGPRRAP